MRLVGNPDRELLCQRAHRDAAGFLAMLLVFEDKTSEADQRYDAARLMEAHALNLETIAADLVTLAEKEEA